jgi:hypothetical protein
MPDLQTLEQMESDPRFALLPYVEQQRLRLKWAKVTFTQDPRFLELNPDQQRNLFLKAMNREPVIAPDKQTPITQQARELVGRIQQGDKTAIDTASSLTFANEGTKTAYFQMFSKVNKWFSDKVFKDERMSELADVAVSTPEEEAYITWLGNEAIMADPNAERRLAKSKRRGQLVAVGLDIAAGRAAGQGIQGLGHAMRSGAVTGGFGKAIKSAAGRRFLGTWIPELMESSIDATGLTARDYVVEGLEKGSADGSWDTTFKRFGANLVTDLAFVGVAKTIGRMLKPLVKTAFGGFGPSMRKIMTKVDDPDELVAYMMGKDIPEGRLQNLAKGELALIKRSRADLFLLKEAAESGRDLTDTELARVITRQMGYDVAPVGKTGKYAVSHMDTGRKIGTFSDPETMVKAVNKHHQKLTGQIITEMDKVAKAGKRTDSDLKLRQYLTVTLDDTAKVLDDNPEQLIRLLSPDRSGYINKYNVKAVAEHLLRKSGLDEETIKQIRSSVIDAQLDNVGRVRMGTPEQATNFIKSFFKNLTDAVPAGQKLVIDNLSELGHLTTKSIPEGGFTPAWIDWAVKKYLPEGTTVKAVSNGLIEVTEPGQSALTYASMQDLGRELYLGSEDITEELLRKHLIQEHGMNLTTHANKEGTVIRYTIRRGRTVIEGGDTIQDLIRRRPYLMPKQPVAHMPEFMFIDDSLKTIEIQTGVVSGPVDQLRKFSTNFKDYTKLVNSDLLEEFGPSKLVIDKTIQRYAVTHPDLGIVKDFTDLKQAQSFLKKSLSKIDDVHDLARAKGYVLRVIGGNKLMFTTGNGDDIVVDGLKDAVRALSELPDHLQVAKEMSGLPNSYVVAISEAEGIKDILSPSPSASPAFSEAGLVSYVKDNIALKAQKKALKATVKGVKKAPVDIGLRASLESSLSPTGKFVEDAERDLGLTGLWEKTYHSIERANATARGLTMNFEKGTNALKRMLGTGYFAQKAADQNLLRIISSGRPFEEYAKVAEGLGINYTPQMEQVAKIGRQLLDDLGKQLGVDPYRMLSEYIPHVQKNLNYARKSGLTARQILDELYGKKSIPKELQFFAHKGRLSDLESLAEGTRLTDLLMIYARRGFRVVNTNEAYEGAKAFLSKAVSKKAIDVKTLSRIGFYLEMSRGWMSDTEVQMMAHANKEAFKTVLEIVSRGGAKMDKIAQEQASTFLTDLMISSTMSFRPWLPIRNLMQVYTTLAPRVGTDIVNRAISNLSKRGDDIWKEMVSSGKLQPVFPMANIRESGKIGLPGKLLKGFNAIGMTPYKSSDDFTRMIAFESANIGFTDAYIRYASKAINEKQFIELSGLWSFSDEIKLPILQKLKGPKGLEAALDSFQDALIEKTMFPYKLGTNPQIFDKSFFGRLFGRFGHYPFYFRANIDDIMRNAPFKMKLVGIGTLAANTAALWYAFDKVLGVDATNFNPAAVVTFSGGPYYSLLNKALNALSLMPRHGMKVWKPVLRDASRVIIPGSLAAKGFVDGVKLMQEGDTYNGFLRMLSVPISKE